MRNQIPKFGLRVLFLLSITIPLLHWVENTGDLRLYAQPWVPAGQIYYVLSKLLGLIGFSLLWWQCIWGLLPHSFSMTFGDSGKQRKQLHKYLGVTLLLLLLGHAASFILASGLRTQSFHWSAFIPNLSDFYHSRMALGIGAIWLLLLSSAHPLLRWSKNILAFKYLHQAGILTVYLTAWHALAIGTEAQCLFMRVQIISMIGLFTGIILYKFLRSTPAWSWHRRKVHL